MSSDLQRALRRVRPQRIGPAPTRRPDDDLPFIGEHASLGRAVLIDTTVYIDVLQGRAPPGLKELLRLRLVNHSSVVLSELTHLFGRLDPADSRTPGVLREVSHAIDEMPAHRLTAPSVRAASEAGMLAGLVARLAGVPAGREQAILNDALIYAQAVERGLVVVTRNAREFDLFDQLWPAESVLFYRAAWAG